MKFCCIEKSLALLRAMCAFVVLIFMKAEIHAAAPEDLLLNMIDNLSPSKIFSYETEDLIRKEKKIYFQRQSKDRIIEKKILIQDFKQRIRLELLMNRSGRWEKNKWGTVKIEYETLIEAGVQSLGSLIKNHAGELTYRNLGLKNVDGNTCRCVEVILSPRLIDILAQKQQAAYRKLRLKQSETKLREDIAGKHIYCLEKKNGRLVKRILYDENGHLLEETAFSNYKSGTIPANFFNSPSEVDFVASSREAHDQFLSHRRYGKRLSPEKSKELFEKNLQKLIEIIESIPKADPEKFNIPQ